MDKSQEIAFALLREAKEKGTLDPTIEKGLAELIGEKGRPQVEEVLKGSSESEKANDRELTPDQQTELLSTIESRFTQKPEHYKRLEGVNFSEVKAALEANPKLMASLAEMERTGGMPDVIAIEAGAFVFGDCSAESPDRRDLTYDQAAKMAKEFGIEMMSEEAYRAMQKTGKFDKETWSWLKTSADIRESGGALSGLRGDGGVDVFQDDARDHNPDRGWRGVLRVPKA